MFIINQGFDLNSPQFNFKRDYFASVADLKAAPETSFPDHFITNVAGVPYLLTKSNTVDETTGRWRKIILGSDIDLSPYAKRSEALGSLSVSNTDSKVTVTTKKVDGTSTSTDIASSTTKAAGVMSAADKAKLDGIAEGANKIIVDSALSATSTNPVQNKVINTALDGKLNNLGGNISALNLVDVDTNVTKATLTVGQNQSSLDGGGISGTVKVTDGSSESITLKGDTGTITANKIVKKGGTSSQLLVADGSVIDKSTFVAAADLIAITDDEINALE